MVHSKFFRFIVVLILMLVAFSLMPNRQAHAATFTVTTNGDGGDTNLADNVCVATSGGCTLRAAIQQANATAGADTINFSTAGPINVGSALPSITQQVTIDGSALVVVLDGSSAGAANGLHINGGNNSTIRGMIIRDFQGSGIVIQASGVTLQLNRIMTNGGHGVHVINGSGNHIGGANSGVRNSISSNGGAGVVLEGAGSTGNFIRANFIGFDFNGLIEQGNTSYGIYLLNASNNAIGGSTAEGNFVGANGSHGIYISGGSGNTVRGNFIGLDNQTGVAGNVGDGVAVSNSPSTVIGNGEGYGNWIIYNGGSGISINASNSSIVQSNTVGAAGVNASSPAPNGQAGLYMVNSSFVTIGGVSGQDNVFAGNGGYGIYIVGGQSVQLLNTEVGTNGPGTADVGNAWSGVRIENGVAFLMDTLMSSGNGGHGLELVGGGSHTIRRNFFGVGGGGTTALANGGDGVYIENSVNNLIGGPNPGEGNTISGNLGNGVSINGSGATGNIVQQSVIGLRLDRTAGIPNGGNGVLINGGNNNQIGQSYTQFNWIAANNGRGVLILSGTGNAVRSQIWANGSLAIDLDANGALPADGVSLNDPLDPDTGGNNLTNYPILTNASNFFVNGYMRGAPNTTYTISLFNSPYCDSSGFGEGENYFNSVNVTTNASGVAAYQTTVPQVSASTVYTAIATGPHGTSEFSPCLRAYTTAVDTLGMFNPSTRNVSLLNVLAHNPPAGNYLTFASGVTSAATNGQWVMGDWNGDGQKTPGVYGPNGVFYYTNQIGSGATWQGIWIGLLNRPVVAGRFNANRTNDCVGAVDSANFPPYGTAFAMYFTCDFVAGSAPPLTFQWLSVLLPDNQGFSGTHQFVAGDFDGDQVDTVAVRRGPFIAYSNTPPTTQNAAFPFAQYIGAPNSGNSNVVAGDWNGDLIDTFGLFYEAGAFHFRDDLDWNSGAYVNHFVGQPIGTPATGASWRAVFAGTGGPAGGEPGGVAAEAPVDAPTETAVQVESQTVESTDSRVTRSGDWAVQSTDKASGGSYVYGTSDATLTLEFYGTSAEVIYLTGPQMGSFTIVVDGVAVRTVIAYADETAFGQRTVVNYLDDGPHTLEIVAVDGRSAIDAFVVGIAQP